MVLPRRNKDNIIGKLFLHISLRCSKHVFFLVRLLALRFSAIFKTI